MLGVISSHYVASTGGGGGSALGDAILADSPIIYLPLQETSGTTAADLSGNSRNATYSSGVTLADTTDAAAPAGVGNHVRLDGTGGHIAMPGGSWFAPASAGFTFEGWFYVRSWASWARVYDFAPSASTQDTYFAKSGTTAGMRFFSGGSGNDYGTLATAGAWKHFAVTVAADGTLKFYEDGVSVLSSSVGIPTNTTRNVMYVGRSAFGSDPYLSASVAHVALYNTVLSAARIAAHHTAGTS